MFLASALFYLLLIAQTFRAEVADTDLNNLSEQQNSVKINKCCENNELMVDSACRLAEQYNQSIWKPQFKTEDGKDANVKYYQFVNGLPDCESTQRRPIFILGHPKSEDELNLLEDGRLRHLIHHEHSSDSIKEEPVNLHESIQIPLTFGHCKSQINNNKVIYKKLFTNESNNLQILATNMTGIYAMVCVPEVKINWRDTSFVMKKVLNPMFHAIAMILYLLVAIIYFVLPTLRDLAGNIITTIMISLISLECIFLVEQFWFLHMEDIQVRLLGIAIFFTPVAFTIIFNVFFYELIYAHVCVNLLQAVLIFYVCVLRQNHVTFLLRKSCCYAEPVPTGEWGDEMTHMNGGNYY
ncbi:Methuselah-like protein 5 [Operophtera brumata]|uniref:Methuselah-like protein 5 n=1 Tax=Operophtera brumata TaxID=104452 RepID=A0A0L7L358_OPEBR|nr:Methuselah-like protein 5 [Operophtera brumata]